MRRFVAAAVVGLLCLLLIDSAAFAANGEEKPAVFSSQLDDRLAQLETPEPGGMAAEGGMELAEPGAMQLAPDPDTPVNSALDLAQLEEVKRQAAEVAAKLEIEKADAAFAQEDLSTALGHYQQALKQLPVREETRELRDYVVGQIAKCEVMIAKSMYQEKDYEGASKTVDSALARDPYDADAQALKKRIEQEQEKERIRSTWPKRIKDDKDVKAQADKVAEYIDKGRQLYDLGLLDQAQDQFERALLLDPYNRAAMGHLRKVNEKRYQAHTREYKATTAHMMQEVRAAWTKPITKEIVIDPSDSQVDQESQSILRAKRKLREKLERIIIPVIEFRQANINDVVQFLVEASVTYDTFSKPDDRGVNIILNLQGAGGGGGGGAGGGVAPPPGFGEEPGGGLGLDDGIGGMPATPDIGVDVPSVTLNLRRISLLDAIRYITEVTNLKFRLEKNVVMIVPANMASGPLITRMYPVQPTFADQLRVAQEREVEEDPFGVRQMGTEQVTHELEDASKFFRKMGVPFPVNASATYNPAVSKLIVVNTAENLAIFEDILAQMNLVPNQVEIEARFVEIAQEDLDELGFEWLLTDNWEVAQKKAAPGTPLSARERLVVEKNSLDNGFTGGNRYWGKDATGFVQAQAGGAVGKILSIATVLTNPEVRMVLHALDRSGKANLLSAPKVTTRSGQNASMKVVTEYIYPTEFETDNVGGNFGSFWDFPVGTDPEIMQQFAQLLPEPIVAIPAAFETRETGVILNVTPTVGPDGYTIDLVMQPEVAELIDWVSYGTIAKVDLKQPVFTSRNVQTSIVIWDGQTVVMGGMIREDVKTIEDKVPILGSIPLIGRLFRNEGEISQKRNLLIFVTARLVDPAGRPIHRSQRAPAAASATGGTETGAAMGQ